MDNTIRSKDDEQDIRLISHGQMINNNIRNIIKLSESDDYLDKKIDRLDESMGFKNSCLDARIQRNYNVLNTKIKSLEADRLHYMKWLRNLTILLVLALIMPFVMLSFFI